MHVSAYRTGWLPLSVFLACAVPAFAQVGSDVPDEELLLVAPTQETWGLASDTSWFVAMADFRPPRYFEGFIGGRDTYQTTTTTVDWWHGVQLPNGAVLVSLEMAACDTSVDGKLRFGMAMGDAPGSFAANITPVAITGVLPGCSSFVVTPSSPQIINNTAKVYWIFVAWDGAFDPSLTVRGFRVRYRLQVSPAPALASFTDVPTTHPFFQFIEALKASGITSGCTPSEFCPDAPLTRGQMAAFLARALGLHFPN